MLDKNKSNETAPLTVFLHGIQIGKLYSLKDGELSFAYNKSYLITPKASKLSASLPLQEAPFDHGPTFAFFTGLLPDEYVRRRLARYLGLSEKNTFALLKEIGGECAGAVSLYPEDQSPDKQIKSTYRILENPEAHDILSHLDKRPMLAGEDDIRISGAGAQNKLIISLIRDKVAIPTGNAPSTHIIKPAIKDIAHSVHNEFFCMKLAKAVGLPVPEVYIRWLEHEPYYLIERYD
ncbi:MAG: HipA N-terminal domain-containing protein, partial [Alphaproteobacteria bacterium]|nr:HipA N-terminal domain-containing protein [Alphaproteobacteria bacterium]